MKGNMVKILVSFVIPASVSALSWVDDKKHENPAELQAAIEALKPAHHVWRAIAWKTCPLDALQTARQEKKPIVTWVFLGVPTDERC
jgi:hypothetical protein